MRKWLLSRCLSFYVPYYYDTKVFIIILSKRAIITQVSMIPAVHGSNCNGNIDPFSASPALIFLEVVIATSIIFWQHYRSSTAKT